jgi:lysophospholipase L1-like esterase
MKKNWTYLLLIPAFIFTAFAVEKKKIKVWLIGDSTMANKEIRTYPETGWGMPFTYFFDSTAEVDNRARNGRSTRSFITEGLWKNVIDNVNEGDYVFIQFGHNDEIKTKATYTTEDEFRTNLSRYVTETRNKKGIPVLLTPVSRRSFDSTGYLKDTHEVYSKIIADVASSLKVIFIDVNTKSQALYRQMGPDASKYLFNHLQAGEHPNYPDGKKDDTHFSELGARKIAEIVLAEIRNNIPDLASRITKPFKK